MRSVRCDVCGTKALIAASQCPKCGNLFEMRDGSGEPLPAAHCSSCDSYYPAHVHSCKWCGTTLTPEKVRSGSSDTAKWVAGGVFVAAVVLGSLARDPTPRVTARPRESAQSKPKPAAPAETVARVTAVAPVDTVRPRDTTESAGNVVPRDAPVPASSTPVPAKSRPSSPWVSMVAKQWVIVRSDARTGAHAVASVGPDSRVQLGESRGSWRRIRSRGIAGWVDVSRASFVAIPRSPRRERRVSGR